MLSWDSESLTGLGSFLIQDAFGGLMINVDMTQQNSVDLTNPAFNILKIKVTPSGESPPPPPEETVVVMFQVDMNDEEVSADGVHITGTFNNWDPGSDEMDDSDGDGIYSIIFELEAGSYHEYKFLNGNSWGSEESVPAECTSNYDGNRFVQVLDMDMVLDTVCFGSCTACEVEPPPSVDPDFAVTMTATSGDVDYDLIFGFSPDATDGYDPGLDQYAPPAPPPPSFDVALAWNSERFYTQIVNGSSDDLIEHIWDVQLQYPPSNEIVLSWDSAGLEGLGTFILQDAFGGAMVSVDMTMEGTLELTNPALNLLKLKVTPSAGEPPPTESPIIASETILSLIGRSFVDNQSVVMDTLGNGEILRDIAFSDGADQVWDLSEAVVFPGQIETVEYLEFSDDLPQFDNEALGMCNFVKRNFGSSIDPDSTWNNYEYFFVGMDSLYTLGEYIAEQDTFQQDLRIPIPMPMQYGDSASVSIEFFGMILNLEYSADRWGDIVYGNDSQTALGQTFVYFIAPPDSMPSTIIGNIVFRGDDGLPHAEMVGVLAPPEEPEGPLEILDIFMILHDYDEIEPPPSVDPDFAVTMTATSGDVDYDLIFGFSPDATDGYDPGLDQYAPPAPPPPSFDVALAWNSERFYTQIVNGSSDDLIEHIWDVQLQYPPSNEIVLSWDSAGLEGLGTFILQDAFGGAMVSVDMTMEGTLELTNPALNLLKLKVTPSGEGPPPPPPDGPEFIAQIGAFSGDAQYGMAFGFSPNATDGFDVGIDDYAPPAPPPPSFDAALGWNGERYYTQIVHGSADDLVEHEWELQLQFPTENLITLVWDNISADLGTFILQDPFGGGLINIDMTQQDNFTIDNPAFTVLKILVTPSGESSPPPELTVVNFIIEDDGNGYQDIQIMGDFTEWETIPMNIDTTGNFWEYITELGEGSYEWGAIENDGSEFGISLPELAGFETNPVVIVDIEGNVSGVTGFTVPYQGGPGGTVVVMFHVDVNEQDVSPDGVHIAGSFNGWDPESDEMDDSDGDGIYSIIFELEAGSYHEYKFLNGDSWGTEESVPPECTGGNNGNRFVYVGDMDMLLDPVCFGECNECDFEPPPEGDPDFAVTMTAESGGVSYDLTFGFSPDATDGFDPGVDQYAPPAPPPPSFDAALAWNGERFYKQIVNGSAEDLVEHEWDIQLQFSPSNEIELSWNSAGLDELGTFILQDPFGGNIINVDMTVQGSLVLTNPALNLLKLKVTPTGEEPPPPPPGDPEFIAHIGAFVGDIDYEMAFGFSPNATDGFDPGLDDYAPPAPPPPSFDAALGWNGERYYTQIVHGSADDLVEHEWEIQLQFPVSGEITLAWDNASWSELGTFILQDPFGGDLINIDMTQQNSFLVDNPAFTVLKLLVTPSGGDEEFSGPHWHVSVDGSDETGNGTVQEPFATVQKAVDMAGVQDTIHVHPGTYYENIIIEDKNLFINGQAGPSVTILDGNGGRVIEFNNVGLPTMLKGFTIQNGYAENNGAGVFAMNSHIRLRDLIISNNSSGGDGGGIFSVQSTLILRNSVIKENYSGDDGGGFLFFSDDTTMDNFLDVENTEFSNNECVDQGCGLFAGGMGFDISILESKFVENSGRRNVGCRINGDVEFEIFNSTIIGNQAQQYAAGGGFSNGCSGVLYKVNISNNIANLDGSGGNSGGLSVWSGANVGFINCNFVDNEAAYGAGLTVGGGGSARLVNSILWGNSNDQLAVTSWNDMGGDAVIYYSDFQDGEEGINVLDDLSSYVWAEGNISADPLFIGEGPNPHLLTESSPCVDAGTAFLVFEEDTLEIPPEAYNGTAPDMGAFESPFGTVGGDPDFMVTINATGGTADYDLTLGFSPTATDGFDPGLDQYAPPAPPPPSFDVALSWNGERFYTQVVNGSANDLVEHEWELQLQFPQSNQISLSWDNSGWSQLGTFILQDPFGGGLININMTEQGGFMVDNPAFTLLKVLVTPFGGEQGPELPDGFEFTPTPLSGIFQGITAIDGVSATENDWIAAFDEEGNCAGAQQLTMFEGQSYINLAIYGDDPLTPNVDEGMNEGEEFLLVVYDDSEDAYLIYPESFSGWFNNNGAPMPPWNDPTAVFNFPTTFTDEIDLMENWNLISFDIAIEENVPENVFQGLISDDQLIYVTGFNEDGSIFFDPNGPPFLNTLSEIIPGSGYWVKVTGSQLLEQEGLPIPEDFSIDLNPNWNLIGYWLHESMPPEDAFNELILADNLIYVTGFTEVGAVFYDPTGLPFLNTLTELYNGYGYWVKVIEGVNNFIYPEPSGVLAKKVDMRRNPDITLTNRFMFINGTVSFEDVKVTENAYVSVTTEDGTLIGEMKVLEDGYLQTGAVYGDDVTTEEKDGAESGERLIFQYDEFVSEPIEIIFSDNMDLQKVDLTFRNIPDEFALLQNIPNPFNPVTSIQYRLPEQTHVMLSVYDILGRKVRTLVNELRESGTYYVMWNGTTDSGESVGSGVYIYELSTPRFTSARKMLIIK